MNAACGRALAALVRVDEAPGGEFIARELRSAIASDSESTLLAKSRRAEAWLELKKFDPHEPRDPHGRWTKKPGGPPVKPWMNPPSPQGTASRQVGGFTAIGISNTKLGDEVESALQDQMGFRNAHPGRRQGKLDLLWDGHGYEVKSQSRAAKEYHAKPKKNEIEEKRAWAAEHGIQPHTMIVVYDPSPKRLYVYSKPGIGAYRLTGPDRGWQFHGTAKLDLGETWDPAAARGLVKAILERMIAERKAEQSTVTLHDP